MLFRNDAMKGVPNVIKLECKNIWAEWRFLGMSSEKGKSVFGGHGALTSGFIRGCQKYVVSEVESRSFSCSGFVHIPLDVYCVLDYKNVGVYFPRHSCRDAPTE